MFSKLFKLIINHAKLSFFLSFFICILLSLNLAKMSVDASAESLLLENDPDLKQWRELSKHYPNDSFIMLAFKPKSGDSFDEINLKKLKEIHKEVEKIDFVERVLSPINAPLLQSSENVELKELLKQIPTLENDNVNLSLAKKELINSPFFSQNIISKNGEFLALIIYLKPDLKYADLVEKRDLAKSDNEKQILREEIQNHQVKQKEINKINIENLRKVVAKFTQNGDAIYLGGVSIIADDMITYIKADMLIYGGAMALLLALALWYFFSSFGFIFIALFTCLVTLAAASGAFVLFGWQITVISSNYAPLVLIITLSIVIHLLNHFSNTAKAHPKSNLKRQILQTLLAKLRPTFFAVLTTIIGFLSLIFSHIEPIIKLGFMMSLGISIALILAYIFVPTLLIIFKIKAPKKREFDMKLIHKCAIFALNYKKQILLASFLALILSGFGISRLIVENSFVNYFKDSSEIKQGLVAIDKNLGGTMPLDIIIKFNEQTKLSNQNSDLDEFENEFESLAKTQTYFFNAHKTRIAKKVHNYLANSEFIGSVLSLNSLLEVGKSINENKELDDFALAFLNENLPENFKNDLLSPFVSIENNELKFSVRTLDSDKNLRRNEFIIKLKNDLNELLKNENVSVHLTGIMPLYNNMLQSLFASQFNTLAFVLGVLLILFIFIFKNLRLAVIALAINVIPLSLIFALMGFFNIPLDIMSITIAAIAIGIGVDDALHYLHNFKTELTKYKIKTAILRSHKNVGSALYHTSLSVVMGFSVMLTSNFIPTIYFGALSVFVMLLLLIGSLILLPSFLMLFLKDKNEKITNFKKA